MVATGTLVTTTVHPVSVPENCPYGCADSGMHCPSVEPLELAVAARQQHDHWIPFFDPTEAEVAFDTVCGACGGRLSYHALSPTADANAVAWAICVVCRHWVAL
jgi:hypothetical protein